MKVNFKERAPQLIAVIAVLIMVLAVAIGWIIHNNRKMADMREEFTIDKQELQDEYEAISMHYEGFKFSVKNDSLLQKFENEQAKVMRLREELRATKASNQKEIKRLKNELGSLRKILRSYIHQIDSLNRLNEALKEENRQITEQFRETSRTLTQVAQEKKQLSEKVSLAAQLVATNVSVKAINQRGKQQKRLKRSTQFVISFLISRNITAEPGERTIYARILAPDGEVLKKSSSNTFAYENKQIIYSIKRVIEYGGEEMPVTMYWDIEEYLMPGTYKADIFADGHHIGSHSFSMQE